MHREFGKGGPHVIFHGEAGAVLNQHVPADSVDLIFADPPYNIGKDFAGFSDRWNTEREYLEWARVWIDACIRVLKPHGSMYLMCSTQGMPGLDLYIREKLSVLSRIVWSYDSSGVQAKKYFGSLYEPVLHCVKNPNSYCFNAGEILIEAKTGAKRGLIDYRGASPKPYNTRKVPGNVWEIPRVRYRMPEYEDHPSQKPEALLERIIKASSNPGNLVLDPFAGSFTTAAVAKKLSRRSISIEIQSSYIKTGLRRVLDFSEYDGEKLMPPVKNTTVKNRRKEDGRNRKTT